MKDLQNIVYKFMEREEVTLKQALLQSSLGCCSKTGDIAEIVRGVVYNGYPYTDERKKRINEHLGELLFYWLMLASTTGASPEQIISEYISSYIQRNKILKEEEIRALGDKSNEAIAGTKNAALSAADSQSVKTSVSGMNVNAAVANNAREAQASILQMLKYVKSNEEKEKKLRERAR